VMLRSSEKEAQLGYELDPEENDTRVLHELRDFRGKNVLEVGCGDGRMTWRYAGETRSVLALEPNQEWINRAVAATPEDLRSTVSFRTGDIASIDLPAAGFDVAILSWSL